MMPTNFLTNFYIALEAILSNKIRSILTALGIIFGVAAVIAMLAIGNGAKQEILEQIKLVGVNNIVITPIVEQKEEKVKSSEDKEHQKVSPGLTLQDVRSIEEILPDIQSVSPEVVIEIFAMRNGLRRSAKLVGVEPDYFEITDFKLEKGSMFNENQLEKGEQVCIIGKSIETKFFPKDNPVGKYLKCGNSWLKVIGVLSEKKISENSISKLGIRDYNMDVYTPMKTMLLRFQNRALVTKLLIQKAADAMEQKSGETEASGDEFKLANYHQVDRVVVQVKNSDDLQASAEIVSRMLARRHYEIVDYEISIPELLLKQQQRTKDIFNIVLGAIAGISLLVGGIGIMNIMLASVLERIKEIGIRLSIGATKKDIVLQFLLEAVMISVTGGITGIILGVMASIMISKFAGIATIISGWSIVISFGVSAIIGLIFGIAPARRAAEQNPIESLRYE